MQESVTISRDVDAALDRGLGSEGIFCDDALLLFQQAPLTELLHAAALVRDRAKGSVVSYSQKVFIPLTQLCRDYCGYCTFRSDPEAGVPAYMTPQQVLAVAAAGKLGATEVCIQGGCRGILDGTLMEESISKAAGANFVEYVSPGEFRSMIRMIGRTPVERTTTYKVRKVFEAPDSEERLPLERMPVFASASNRSALPATGY